ncbi:PPC domain-containing DNA-binding protein [Eupransor demetentiae]|uniref:PPC/DUF296 domain (AF0104) n=1 Tax=Eupransor demetentiae TaxID=3109584 RepID=A0ABP0ERF4_9LACO|nr:PPC/DUF296 domain (AF0104) [Lactobacillaceae bacterium LMG 33000]
MQIKQTENHDLIKLEKGDQLMAAIKEFALEKQVSGTFSGIGAMDKVVISTYLPEKSDFLDHEKEGLLEMFTLTGNVSWNDAEPVVHAHAGFSFLDGNQEVAVIAGDLREAHVSYTAEILFVPETEKIMREFDSKAGIDVWKLN